MASLKDLETYPSSPVRRATQAALSALSTISLEGWTKEAAETTPVEQLLHQLQLSSQNEDANGVIKLLQIVADREADAQAALPLEPVDVLNPSHHNVLLTDIHEDTLRDVVAARLAVGFLSVAETKPSFPVHGCLHGRNSRCFCMRLPLCWILRAPGCQPELNCLSGAHRPVINLVVRSHNKPAVNIIFVVDTGSADTYLSTTTLDALGFLEHTPPQARVYIHGYELEVFHSPPKSNFADVNLLGASFMLAARARLDINYDSRNQSFTITTADQA
jgi:hypothetical protein